MADTPAEAVAGVAAEAITDAATKVADAATAIVADTSAQLEIAQERIATAEATAQAVTDAALQSEIGKQVTSVREDMDEWESEIEARLDQLQSQQTALQEQQTILSTGLSELRTLKVTTVETVPSSISETLPPPVEGTKTVIAEIVDPVKAPTASSESIPSAAPKKARWI